MDRRYALGMSAGAATPEELKARIEAGIPGARAEVTGDGHHFSATIRSSAFRGLSRIQAHRLVYQVFGTEIGGRIHALSIQTQAEENGEQA
jgi:acid stress-induced BolA-like protein IbaG/YrbA